MFIRTEKNYEVRHYEVGAGDRATLPAILNYLNDLVRFQSESLGIGLEYYAKTGQTWVLYKWNVEFLEIPVYQDVLTLATWPVSMVKFYGYRKFEILKAGKPMVSVNSQWIYIDRNTKRPTRPPEIMYQAYEVPMDSRETLPMGQFRESPAYDTSETLMVRKSDIDFNQHVYNVRYLDWILETLPNEVECGKTPKALRMEFRKEALFGDQVTVETQKLDESERVVYVHRITSADGSVLLMAESEWAL